VPCRSFASAEEFLDSDAAEHAGILVLDIHLPGLSGFELHEHLVLHGKALPVVFITGEDQPLNRERALRTGAAAYLTKPFPAELLINAVRSHLAAGLTLASLRTDPTTPPHTP
jgi:FixJ family two-component response regulator